MFSVINQFKMNKLRRKNYYLRRLRKIFDEKNNNSKTIVRYVDKNESNQKWRHFLKLK